MKRFFVGLLLTILPRHCAKAQALRCQHDWHDYYDAADGDPPTHWYTYTCERCRKEFTI